MKVMYPLRFVSSVDAISSFYPYVKKGSHTVLLFSVRCDFGSTWKALTDTRMKALDLKKPSRTLEKKMDAAGPGDEEESPAADKTVSVGATGPADSDASAHGVDADVADEDLMLSAHLLVDAEKNSDALDSPENPEHPSSENDDDREAMFRAAVEAVQSDGIEFGEDDDGNICNAAQIKSMSNAEEKTMLQEAVAASKFSDNQLAAMVQHLQQIDPEASRHCLSSEEVVAEALLNNKSIKGNIDLSEVEAGSAPASSSSAVAGC